MQEFNDQLVEENENLTIIDYIKLANDKIHHIEIDFIDDFMNLVNKEGFIIPHDMLLKYEVLSDTTNSAHVMRLLNQYEFEVETDYIIKKEEAIEYQDVLGSSSL